MILQRTNIPKQNIYKDQLIFYDFLNSQDMKKISIKKFQNQHQITRLKTETGQNFSKIKVNQHSINRPSWLDGKQNDTFQPRFNFRSHQKSNTGQWNDYPNKQSLLRNMLDSSDRKRSDILNNLIKTKRSPSRTNIHNDLKFNKMIKIKTQQSEVEHYPFRSIRKESHQKCEHIIKLNRLETIGCSFNCMTERNRPLTKLSTKQSQFLQNSFNKRIKEIKQRKYLQKQQFHSQKTTLMQPYGSTLKGQKHEENQDSTYFSKDIYVICDGHGSNGKHVSSFVAQNVHNQLKLCLLDKKIDENLILQTYRKIDLELDNSNFDTSFSGCTCVTVLRIDNNLFCINLGDSKAIMAKNKNALELTKSHKPDYPSEKLRIQNYGGVVKSTEISKDKFVGPMRIWAPGKNSWGPGLALSRAFGDKAARKYGLISVPQVTQIKLTPDIQFIVIGSDGLFDFFQNQEICDFIHLCLKDNSIPKSEIANHLVNEARKKWSSDSDDISCIIIFL